jgi:hypothetical protein
MKAPFVTLIAFLAISAAFAEETINTSVTLRDASVIKGTVTETTVLEGAIVFADDVKIPLPLVRDMVADGTNGVQIVTLTNGDVFRLTPKTKALTIATVLGDLTIPLANMRKVSFSASGSTSDNLIYYCTFDSPEAIQKPAIGPAGKFLSGRFVEGKVGEALAVRAYTSGAYLQLPPNTIGQKGCFEFWAKFTPPAERIGVGQWPCFFTCGVLGAAPRFCLEWNANNGTGGGGVNAMLEHIRACTSTYGGSHSYFEFLGNAMTEWHHYALVWNKDGIPSLSSGASLPVKAAIFLDGKPIARESFRNVPNWKLSPSITDPITFLSFPTHPEDSVQNHVDYVVDEFKFWNFDRTDFEL